MELISDGLTLRSPIVGDAPRLVEAVLESLPELSRWMPWAGSDYDESMARKWIDGEFGDAHPFVMIDANDDLVGTCGLNKVDELNRSANLGYWVRTASTGLGYATRATRLLADHGHRTARLNRMEVVMSVHNVASRRVAEKAGAHHEGIARGALLLAHRYHDAHVWSFVAAAGTSPPDEP